MTDADDLIAAAAGLMVKVVCPVCDREVAVVRGSAYGALLLWERPTEESRMWMRMIKPWATSFTVTEDPGHDPRKRRTRVLNPRGPGDLPHPKARYVRRLDADADARNPDDLHCRDHGNLSLSRSEITAALDRAKSGGRVTRAAATIRDTERSGR